MSKPGKILPEISAVIPIFNEAGNIARLVDSLQEVFEEMGITWEAILVDDGSEDGSWDELQLLTNKHENLSIIRFTRNFGKEAAINAGLSHAQATTSLVMDSDMQHPPELIKQMWAAMNDSSVDVVSAVKTKRQQESIFRGSSARLFYWLFRKSTGIDLESSTDFKLISARVRKMYLSLPEKHQFFRGLTRWFGFPEKTITFDPPPRHAASPSHWSTASLIRYALRNLASFSSLPIHVLGWLGGGTLLFTLVLGVQTLYMKFAGHAVEGFTTVILVILFIGSILMIWLAIVGAYVIEIYQQVRQRPTFIIREVHLSQESSEAIPHR